MFVSQTNISSIHINVAADSSEDASTCPFTRFPCQTQPIELALECVLSANPASCAQREAALCRCAAAGQRWLEVGGVDRGSVLIASSAGGLLVFKYHFLCFFACVLLRHFCSCGRLSVACSVALSPSAPYLTSRIRVARLCVQHQHSWPGGNAMVGNVL